jgi:hypothetical protein
MHSNLQQVCLSLYLTAWPSGGELAIIPLQPMLTLNVQKVILHRLWCCS